MGRSRAEFFHNSRWQSALVDALCSSRIAPGGRVFMPNRFRAARAAVVAAGVATPTYAQQAYIDPQGSGVLVSAVTWLQGTLLGTIATVVAVIAVATVGFMMLTGRINWRYGATVILGCFILFGASTIVAGIHSSASLGQSDPADHRRPRTRHPFPRPDAAAHVRRTPLQR